MDKQLLKSYIKGALTFIPGLHAIAPKQGTGGGTDSADYCYGVWLKHLSLLSTHETFKMPSNVAELGPGSSLGVGLTALLSGCSSYKALDLVAHITTASNLEVFDLLLEKLKRSDGRPSKGWPDFDDLLNTELFPDHILTPQVLETALEADRVARLRAELLAMENAPSDIHSIQYVAPWNDAAAINTGSVELIYSQSVLEYFPDLDACYADQWRWLQPGGYISHQIDLSSHGITQQWDGMRSLNALQWKIVYGNRPFGLNRKTCSEHLAAIERAGFEIALVLKRNEPAVAMQNSDWQQRNPDDAQTSGLFVQARKPLA